MTHMIAKTATQTGWIKYIAGGIDDDIDVDNDGVMPSTRILVDLSQGLSIRLGRQMSMMSTYKVNYVRIDLLNVDDANDNEDGASFSGRCQYWHPTKYRMEAMTLARQLENAHEATELDGDSFLLSTENDYTGIRFNWDADGQVEYATGEGFTGLAGSEWDLAELFEVYGTQLGAPTQNNALWSPNNRTGFTHQFGFAMDYRNATDDNNVTQVYHPEQNAFVMHLNDPIEVLGGLMEFDITHSSADPPTGVDDDYAVQITIGVSGWSDF